MEDTRRSAPVVGISAVLSAFLAVVPVSSGYGQRGNHERVAAIEAGRQPDPCSGDFPPGHAYGLRRECEPEGTSAGIAKGDFNGDGFADLAIGVPNEDLVSSTSPRTFDDAGAVNVIYGSAEVLSATAGPGNQFWTQDSSGVLEAAEAFDRFGSSLASGDFNGDGFSDLAVGVPGEDINGRLGAVAVADSGGVNVLYGSANGLTANGNQFWNQNSLDLPDVAEEGDRFGTSLAWGDFNGDSFGDLVVGVPAEDVPTTSGEAVDAGAINVVYGSNGGLTDESSQFWNQDSQDVLADILDRCESGDGFGSSITSGDFNGDGRSDLAIGVPFEDRIAVDDGLVNVIYGGFRLSPDNGSQAIQNFLGGDVSGDQFGKALAAGNFNGDHSGIGHPLADLAIAAPFHDVETAAGAGAVFVLYGTANGLLNTGSEIVVQAGSSAPEEGDNFGLALAAGDFNANGFQDLAIGVPNEDLEQPGVILRDAGVVNAIYGTEGGLRIAHVGNPTFQTFSQGLQPGTLHDPAEGLDQFGASLTAWNFGEVGPGSGFADLAIGVPGENVGSVADAGAVWVLYGLGPTLGLQNAASQFWVQGSDGILDRAEAGDQFGKAVY